MAKLDGLWIQINTPSHTFSYISYSQLSQYSPGLFAVGGTVLAAWMCDEICDGANFMQLPCLFGLSCVDRCTRFKAISWAMILDINCFFVVTLLNK